MYSDMNKEKFEGRSNLRISGAGTYQGGIFHNIKISGSANINGDVECISMDTSGSSKVDGNVTADEVSTSGACNLSGNLRAALVKTSGSIHIGGDVHADHLSTSGSTRVGGNVKAELIEISGGTNIGGNVHSENVIISGYLSSGGDCEAERVEISGGFKIEGLLNAGNVKIKVGGKCRVREIGGEKIEIKRWSHFGMLGLQNIIKAIFNYESRLVCQSIEGDEIYLENTKADVVRGNNIVIGRECEIGAVEYSGSLSVVDGGTVREEKKI